MARNTISYEWSINECEGNKVAYGPDAGDVEWDIIDNNFRGELSKYSDKEVRQINGEEYQLELLRYVHDDVGDLKDRQYASVEVLPDHTLKLDDTFDNGVTKVPAKFHKELAQLNKRLKALLAKAAR